MIEFLRGTLARRSPTEAVVECNGVGYLIQISLNTYSALPVSGTVELLVHPHYGENVQRLYGFADNSERELFRVLQGVRGVGPALAMTLLSHEPVDVLIGRLRAGDVTGLTRIKGVGKKTAERLLVELKDRMDSFATTSRPRSASADREELLVQALTNLGMTANEAHERAQDVLAGTPDNEPIENLLRQALKARTRARGKG